MKPKRRILFSCGYMPLLTVLSSDETPSRFELADGHETDISNYLKFVFVQYAATAKTWQELQSSISEFLGVV